MSGGGSSTTQVNNIPDQLKPLATAYSQKAMEIGNNPYQAYTGQRVVQGLNQDQNSAANYFRQGMSQGTNPYLDQMVGKAQSNLTDNYTNVIRPQQDALSARSGSFGNSGVQSLIGQQQKQLMNGLGDISTQMYGNQYNADQGRRDQAAQNLLGVGGMQQAQQQAGLDFNYQQFQEAQNQPYKNLGAMAAPFGSNMGGSSTQQQKSDPFQTLLGLGLLGGAYFSDQRLKEDIKRVGETDDGLGIYTYKYLGDDKTQMGVMAQEVQQKKPDAVSQVDGLLMVDYSKV